MVQLVPTICCSDYLDRLPAFVLEDSVGYPSRVVCSHVGDMPRPFENMSVKKSIPILEQLVQLDALNLGMPSLHEYFDTLSFQSAQANHFVEYSLLKATHF